MTFELRHALRRLRQRPAFSFAAIATLALGIGFSTVVFSLVNFLLLRPLPVSDSERLVSLHTGEAPGFSFPNYLDIREGNEVFHDVAALRVMPIHVNRGGEKARLWGYLLTVRPASAMILCRLIGSVGKHGSKHQKRRGREACSSACQTYG